VNLEESRLKRENEEAHRRCPVCNGADFTFFYKMTYEFLRDKHGSSVDIINCIISVPENTLDIVVCKTCGMVYTRNLYDFSEIRERIGLAKDSPLTMAELKEAHKEINSQDFLMKYHIVQILMRLLLDRKRSDLKILDFGGGYVGIHARLANMYGRSKCIVYDPIVAEADVEGIKFLNQLSKVWQEKPFDGTICNQVLEHCLNPRQELKNIYELLRPGGYAFLAVPLLSYKKLSQYYEQIIQGKGEAAKIVHLNHINYFSLKNFTRLIKETGFEIVPVQVDLLMYKSHPCANSFVVWEVLKALRSFGFRLAIWLNAYSALSMFFGGSFFVKRP